MEADIKLGNQLTVTLYVFRCVCETHRAQCLTEELLKCWVFKKLMRGAFSPSFSYFLSNALNHRGYKASLIIFQLGLLSELIHSFFSATYKLQVDASCTCQYFWWTVLKSALFFLSPACSCAQLHARFCVTQGFAFRDPWSRTRHDCTRRAPRWDWSRRCWWPTCSARQTSSAASTWAWWRWIWCWGLNPPQPSPSLTCACAPFQPAGGDRHFGHW